MRVIRVRRLGLAAALVCGLLLGGAYAVEALESGLFAPAELNPCAAKTINPCAAKTINPCAAKTLNPCAAKTQNPRAAKAIKPRAAMLMCSTPSTSAVVRVRRSERSRGFSSAGKGT